MPAPKCPLGQQIAAVTRLYAAVEREPRLLGRLNTAADRAYLLDGLAGAIDTLRFIVQHERVIRAALAAERSRAGEAAT